MPNTWKNGRIASTRSVPEPMDGSQAAHCCMLMEMLAWVSIAPLGVPVVPPVYCSTAISPAGSMLTGVYLPSVAMTSS